MSRVSSVKKLPTIILAQLHTRLRDSGLSDFDAHHAWLTQQGFAVSRSALHRYVAANKTIILRGENPVAEVGEIETRLRCLEIATKLDCKSHPKQLMNDADALLQWVCGG